MGRLFWKFLFSYWAAFLIAGFGVTTSVWLLQKAQEDPALVIEESPRASFEIGSSIATLRHGGPAALREWVLERRRSHEDSVFVVDQHGQDIASRPVPPAALDRARQMAATGSDADAARQVTLTDGSTWLFFMPRDANQPRRGGGRPPSAWVPMTVGVIASLLFGVFLAWYVARPIRRLRDGFAALSAGRMDARVAPLMGSRRDEVADLGRDFDHMAQQLQTLVGSQRSLLHDVSHELRSPLARLQAAIGLARQNPQRIESSFERIEREAQRLDELVEQLLTLSRLDVNVDEGPLARVERTDLIDLVASIAADAQFEAQASDRQVTFAATDEASADVRPELLHRAVENVVRNAVKYTAPGTTVEVRAGLAPGGGAFVVRVCDRGPGVPADELETIFQPFYRSASAPTGPGFGLGLAITRRAIEAHGGTALARLRDGGGLEIELALPIATS